MQQKIFLENFKTFASVGVYEHEKKDKQQIIINLEITLHKNETPILDKLKNAKLERFKIRSLTFGIASLYTAHTPQKI